MGRAVIAVGDRLEFHNQIVEPNLIIFTAFESKTPPTRSTLQFQWGIKPAPLLMQQLAAGFDLDRLPVIQR